MKNKIEQILQEYYLRDLSLDDATQQVLDLFAVVGRSEQLKAFLEWFDKPEKLLDHDELIKQYKEESL